MVKAPGELRPAQAKMKIKKENLSPRVLIISKFCVIHEPGKKDRVYVSIDQLELLLALGFL